MTAIRETGTPELLQWKRKTYQGDSSKKDRHTGMTTMEEEDIPG